MLAYCYQPLSDEIHQIYSIRLDGSENVKMIESTIGLNHHSWSPDGTMIAAVGYYGGTWSIHTFNIDGTGLTRLTATAGVWDCDPSWSPDGTKIAFTRNYPSSGMRHEIWVMNVDGSGQSYIGVRGFAARYSPDGTRFVYHSNKEGDNEIYICNVDGTGEVKVEVWPGTSSEMNPSWSPDGTRIVFTSNIDGSPEVYTAGIDGSSPLRLTDNTVDEFTPKYSPDGTMIAFASGILYDAGNPVEVWVVNADGSGLTRVTHSPAGVTAVCPDWQPADSTSVDVFLHGFRCMALDDAVEIEWSTSGGLPVEDFRLEAVSDDGTRLVPVISTGYGQYSGLDEQAGLQSGGRIEYRLFISDDGDGWRFIHSETFELDAPEPRGLLLDVYPNPFNPSTTVTFRNGRLQRARLSIFDLRGRMIRVLADDLFTKGSHAARWDGLDSRGRKVASGLYFLRVEAGKSRESKKLVLAR
ncbi:MAG TPA: T9SS type A sorting domain-containing protein [Candidatus Krumholzibacterium sp.]|nr:T9SS type A sorting domain-containing protein [Candidatus Krumholzibacterium sp.]